MKTKPAPLTWEHLEDFSRLLRRIKGFGVLLCLALATALTNSCATAQPGGATATDKKPNILILMTDDTGWNDFGAYTGGGRALGHATPNIDRIAKEGALFTSWYGQASCTAGRASFITGRIPIRTALSIVVAPGDENALTKETPTIAEFFKKNGYSTYFSGKWHLGDKPESFPIEHGFDEMKHFAAYFPACYTYNDTSKYFYPWFPSYNPEFNAAYHAVMDLYEWEGVAGQPPSKGAVIDYAYLQDFDTRQTATTIDYIKKHAKDAKPFFLDMNFMKMHVPTHASAKFAGKSHLGDYSDALLELDDQIGQIMDVIRSDAPNTIVVLTADNGAWQDAFPDGGTTPFRGEKGTPFEGGFRVPGMMWWPGHIPAGVTYDEMMSHIDCWSTLAKMAELTPPPHGGWSDNNGKPIYFDSIDNSDYIFGKAKHSARRSWVYIDGETFQGARADLAGDPNNPDLNIAWKYIATAKDTWLGPEQNLGAIGALYNLTMDPFEKYDMTFTGSASTRLATSSPGRWTGRENSWATALIVPVVMEFNKSIVDFPSKKRVPGGASTDWVPNLQRPDNPLPLLDMKKPTQVHIGTD